MHCLVLVGSGNQAFKLCNLLKEHQGVFEIASVPCKLSRTGCGYCIKCPCEAVNILLNKAKEYAIRITDVYRVDIKNATRKYEKIL